MRTLQSLQRDVDTWIKEHGVRYFDELTNMALLSEEVGELSRHIARQYGEQNYKNPPTDPKRAIADEMADVLFVLTCLANQLDIDLDAAVKQNLEKKTNRDKSRHKRNKKLS